MNNKGESDTRLYQTYVLFIFCHLNFVLFWKGWGRALESTFLFELNGLLEE